MMTDINLTKKEMNMLIEALDELRSGPEAQYEFGINRKENEKIIKSVKKLEDKLRKARNGPRRA